MIGIDSAGPRNAWLLLLVISAISFGAAELMQQRHIAIAAIVGIAAAKILIILVRFMDIDRAPTGIRRYMFGWTFVVSAAIFALWFASVG